MTTEAQDELKTTTELRRPPYAFAKRHGVLVDGSAEGDGAVKVLHRAGLQPTVVTELRRFLRRPLRLEPISDETFNRLLSKHYESGTDGARAMMDDLGEGLDLDRVAESLPEPEDLLESEDDAPIIRLINALLTQAIKENASDIHIEPFENRLSVRLRVDGVLHEVLEPPRNMAPLIVSRIKVMARLDIAEKRLPQDGRISLRVAGRAVDVRVSTLPSGNGERVVLRLLDKQAGQLQLQQLNMNEQVLNAYRRGLQTPHGIILVTGPTGSGKTTTLYAMLSVLNDAKRNILTVEDPVEYDLDGIGQTPVNTKVDMTFAKGLRAILRQDPDVVMVGEIRDSETAQIAVQASLTGHLVLSTLHTNSAVGAITRLQDMGVEPFLLSSTLLGVISQRLVRNLCPACKTVTQLDVEQINGFEIDPSDVIYQANGCPQCLHTGFRGRTGIYEMIEVDDELTTMIHDGTGQRKIEKYCRTKSHSLREDGIRKVVQGDTTLDEVLRVTRDGG